MVVSMGTYTANYQLYMPTIGEQGWGELINGNYQTIDTTMKSFSNRIGTLETETDAFDSRITALEDGINVDLNGNITPNKINTVLKSDGLLVYNPAFVLSGAIPSVITTFLTFKLSNSGMFNFSGTYSCTMKYQGHDSAKTLTVKLLEDGVVVFTDTTSNSTINTATYNCKAESTYEFQAIFNVSGATLSNKALSCEAFAYI